MTGDGGFCLGSWYRASTLAERQIRAEAYPGGDDRSGDSLRGTVPFEPALADDLEGLWRQQPLLAKDVAYRDYLAFQGLSRERFRSLLGLDAQVLVGAAGGHPPWLQTVLRAYREETPAALPELPEGLRADPACGFLNLVAPLARRACRELAARCAAIAAGEPAAPFDPETVPELFLVHLWRPLMRMISRVLVLELNVARVSGRLHGDTSEARFQVFLADLRQPPLALAILERHPVLARQLVLWFDQWVETTSELLQRLTQDLEAIRACFAVDGEIGRLSTAYGGLGDRHDGGRTVHGLEFTSGLRLVYKPHSQAVAVHFQELLRWCNEACDLPPFRTLAVLDRGDYGWAEWVAAEPCRSRDQLCRFYQRQGAYLALLHALAATDFHYENLIAAGEHPVLIDLETLFHGVYGLPDASVKPPPSRSPRAESVLSVGLLPQREWGRGKPSVDLSGLGKVHGQVTPTKYPVSEQAGSDTMHFTRRPITIPSGQNRASLNGETVDPVDFEEEIRAGFVAMYRTLLNHRDVLLSRRGALRRFANDEVRFVTRPTRVYGTLLNESFHPDLLRDQMERESLWAHLWRPDHPVPGIDRVWRAELVDLERCDVPRFSTRPDSRDLWSASGERIPEILSETGLERAGGRLGSFGEADLARQSWLIGAALAAAGASAEPDRPRRALPRDDGRIDASRWIDAARRVGDRLETLALPYEPGVTWFGVHHVEHDHWRIDTAGFDLYNGLGGIALFLAHLGAVTGENRYSELAVAAMDVVGRWVDEGRASSRGPRPLGAFTGWGGLAYVWARLGALWRNPTLLDRAVDEVAAAADDIEADRRLDVLGGTAGFLASVATLHRHRPTPDLLAVATRCGVHLLDTAERLDSGIGWRPDPGASVGSRPLAGLSHGAAGIAWALARLFSLTGDERFAAGARRAIRFERTLFVPEAGNWLDLREGEEPGEAPAESPRPRYMVAWCHGAPGIGLARLETLAHLGSRHLDDGEIVDEIGTALATTWAQGFGSCHCLCHGDLGNLELLMRAGTVPRFEHYAGRARARAGAILRDIEDSGWRCGAIGELENPGLMTGLAGIGYQLLRLAAPDRVPSVLVLD